MPYPFNIPTPDNPTGGYYAHYGIIKPSMSKKRISKKKNTKSILSGVSQSEREAKGYNNQINY